MKCLNTSLISYTDLGSVAIKDVYLNSKFERLGYVYSGCTGNKHHWAIAPTTMIIIFTSRMIS